TVIYGSVPNYAAAERRTHLLSVFYTISIGAAAVSPPAAGFLSDLIGIPGTVTIVSALTLATIPCAFLLKDLRHTATYRGACYFVRFRGEADIQGRGGSIASVADDPKRNPAVQRSPGAFYVLSFVAAQEGLAASHIDSEQFRSAPRTCGPLYGRLMCRKTERTGRLAG